jgi:hypothetical protein
MKKVVIAVCLAFFLFTATGCDRIETAFGLYKKVKEDAKTKSEQAREEAGKIINKKLPGAPDASDNEDEEKEDKEDKD